jgi:D-galactose 1-dehydrogenase
MTVSIAIVGPGKIARDQHIPRIAESDVFELAAVVSRRGASPHGVPVFGSLRQLLDHGPRIDAVAFCTPPHGRHGDVRLALRAGCDVLLEKPPAATLAELSDLEREASETGQVLFATWHSQFNPGVEEARAILAAEDVDELRITWRESVWRWHPSQDWIWEPGGFGVFDPGINALSILTRILPFPLFVAACSLEVPQNRQAPIAAEIRFQAPCPARISAEFDWRERDDERWDMRIVTRAGTTLSLRRGGGELEVDGELRHGGPKQEYAAIYRRFAELIATRTSDIDAAPLRLAADAMLLASRHMVEPFDWEVRPHHANH